MSTWTVEMKQKAAQKASTQNTAKNEPSCYCPHCGKPQWPRNNFCNRCGTPVADLHHQVATHRQSQQHASYTPIEE